MPDRPLETLAALAALCLLLAAPAAGQLATAWSDEAGGGAVAALRSRAPWSLRGAPLVAGADVVLAAIGRQRLLALDRASGRLAVMDRRAWRERRGLHIAGAEDVVASGPCTAWVTRRTSAVLLRVDVCRGTVAPAADLATFADPDGNPDLGAMAIDGGRLLVQVRRQNAEVVSRFVPPAYLAVVDLASGALVDADPAAPGVQAITLAGTAPKHRMQVLGRRLYVSASGGPFDAGGLEVVDLDGLRSLGLLLREADGQTGADLGPFAMLSAERGYVVYSTDFDLSSHLKPFTARDGVDPGPELHVAVGYAVPALVIDPLTATLFLPDGVFGRRGIWAYDAHSGARLRDAPTALGGRPTDLILLRGATK